MRPNYGPGSRPRRSCRPGHPGASAAAAGWHGSGLPGQCRQGNGASTFVAKWTAAPRADRRSAREVQAHLARGAESLGPAPRRAGASLQAFASARVLNPRRGLY